MSGEKSKTSVPDRSSQIITAKREAPLDPQYWRWVRWAASKLKADGCSKAVEVYHEACLEHDIAYRTGRDPRMLFYYHQSVLITRAEVDARFRQEMQRRSFAGKLSPMSWWRWAGVRLFGGFKAWKGE